MPRAPLTLIEVDRPFEVVGVDVLQMPTTRSGKNYIVVFVDHFTKWPEAFATSNQEALTLLVKRVILTHGVPKCALGQRSKLQSKLISEVYQLLGVRKVYTYR